MSTQPNPDDMTPEARAWLERVQRFRRDNPDALRSPDIHPTRRRTDPQPDPRTDHEQPDLLGEGVAPKPWPTVAPAPANEQRVLAMPQTTEGKFAAWAPTAEGARVLATFLRLARAKRAAELQKVRAARRRIGGKAIWEDTRDAERVPMNNDFQPLAVRWAEAQDASLVGWFEKRLRKAV